jgi:hypothetical protein
MKNSSLILFTFFALLFTTTINASNNAGNDSEVERIINSKATYPTAAKELMVEGVVEVLFIIDLNGNVQLLDMESTDKIFEESLKKDLSTINFSEKNIIRNQIYKIKVNYKLL